jgi:pimeloyl-ACP methyl ester carboxylesterase
MGQGFSSPAVWGLIGWAVATDVPHGLDRIDCPVLLLQGTIDAIAAGQTPRYLMLIRNARFQPLFGAGHAAQGDAPVRVAQLVRDNAASAHDRSVR